MQILKAQQERKVLLRKLRQTFQKALDFKTHVEEQIYPQPDGEVQSRPPSSIFSEHGDGTVGDLEWRHSDSEDQVPNNKKFFVFKDLYADIQNWRHDEAKRRQAEFNAQEMDILELANGRDINDVIAICDGHTNGVYEELLDEAEDRASDQEDIEAEVQQLRREESQLAVVSSTVISTAMQQRQEKTTTKMVKRRRQKLRDFQAQIKQRRLVLQDVKECIHQAATLMRDAMETENFKLEGLPYNRSSTSWNELATMPTDENVVFRMDLLGDVLRTATQNLLKDGTGKSQTEKSLLLMSDEDDEEDEDWETLSEGTTQTDNGLHIILRRKKGRTQSQDHLDTISERSEHKQGRGKTPRGLTRGGFRMSVDMAAETVENAPLDRMAVKEISTLVKARHVD
eukprot:scaffold7055_cov254-Pinguiococcus_pyrenoidosus.AAC.18